MGILSQRPNHTQEAWVYSHDGPIIRRKRGYIFTTAQSYAGSVGIFSRGTNHTQEAWAYSHDGPIIRRKRGTVTVTVTLTVTMTVPQATCDGVFCDKSAPPPDARVPPGATLEYDVELVKVTDIPAQMSR
eukprot:372102-Prorocentrum_minimum.AAC.1